MKLNQICLAVAALATVAGGCRSVAYESMHSSTKTHTPMTYKGDPYTWGGIQEGTGGLVAATKQSMEAPKYTEPKFKSLAGREGFVSMSGWSLGRAKPSDVRGDYQPLPSDAHADPGHAADAGGSQH
jgi:hypothetical protein